jgi:hypothetical protein
MGFGDVLRTATGVVSDVVACAWRLVARVAAPLTDPLGRLLLGPDVPPAAEAINGGPPDGVRERVEAAKFSLGTRREPAPVVDREMGSLPRAYGIDRAVLLARDPWWLFAYWEVTPVTRIATLRRLGGEAEGATETLRVHVVDGTHTSFFDVSLPPGTERWHLEARRPGATFRIEVGVRTRAGRFVPLVASGPVTTMPAGPSDDTRIEWVDLDRSGPRTVAPPLAPSPATAPASWPVVAGIGSSDVHAPLPPR